jgi:hypothetical protein
MKKASQLFVVSLIVFLAVWVISSCTVENGGAITQLGKITTIDPNLHRIYVKIPFGYRHFIVMGHINANTVFVKDGHAAKLSDFSEGEPVVVQWRETENGQLIVSIKQSRTDLVYY